MNTKVLIYVGGLYNLAFAVFHLGFARLFGWKKELHKLSLINGSIMQVLNFCLVFVFLTFAYVSFLYGADLLQSRIGRTLLAAIALFWFVRAMLQPVFFNSIVTGRPRIATAVGTGVFLVGGFLYLMPLLRTL